MMIPIALSIAVLHSFGMYKFTARTLKDPMETKIHGGIGMESITYINRPIWIFFLHYLHQLFLYELT